MLARMQHFTDLSVRLLSDAMVRCSELSSFSIASVRWVVKEVEQCRPLGLAWGWWKVQWIGGG